jgi:hypothetical protein
LSYSTIHTDHSVGDVVFFHEAESDTVVRGVVTKIEAVCATAGYQPKWTILYSVAPKWAHEKPARDYLISQGDLKTTARDAFPEELPEVAEVTP